MTESKCEHGLKYSFITNEGKSLCTKCECNGIFIGSKSETKLPFPIDSLPRDIQIIHEPTLWALFANGALSGITFKTGELNCNDKAIIASRYADALLEQYRKRWKD